MENIFVDKIEKKFGGYWTIKKCLNFLHFAVWIGLKYCLS